MGRRSFFRIATAAAGGAFLVACGRPKEVYVPTEAEEILAAAGLSAPVLEASVEDGVLELGEPWSKVVTFSGRAVEIDAWVAEKFASGIQTKSYKDDLAEVTGRLGFGVQKKGDRIVSGIEETKGRVAFVVVVGQQYEPVVRAAVWGRSR